MNSFQLLRLLMLLCSSGCPDLYTPCFGLGAPLVLVLDNTNSSRLLPRLAGLPRPPLYWSWRRPAYIIHCCPKQDQFHFLSPWFGRRGTLRVLCAVSCGIGLAGTQARTVFPHRAFHSRAAGDHYPRSQLDPPTSVTSLFYPSLTT